MSAVAQQRGQLHTTFKPRSRIWQRIPKRTPYPASSVEFRTVRQAIRAYRFNCLVYFSWTFKALSILPTEHVLYGEEITSAQELVSLEDLEEELKFE